MLRPLYGLPQWIQSISICNGAVTPATETAVSPAGGRRGCALLAASGPPRRRLEPPPAFHLPAAVRGRQGLLLNGPEAFGSRIRSGAGLDTRRRGVGPGRRHAPAAGSARRAGPSQVRPGGPVAHSSRDPPGAAWPLAGPPAVAPVSRRGRRAPPPPVVCSASRPCPRRRLRSAVGRGSARRR